jgi:ferredoxin
MESLFRAKTAKCAKKTKRKKFYFPAFLRGLRATFSNQTCQRAELNPYFGSDFELNFMADAANKYPENVAGKYYVDNQCIDCDLCRETAPDNYKRNDDGGYSFVYKQPTTPEEEARCKEAKEGCPVEAIGDNG